MFKLDRSNIILTRSDTLIIGLEVVDGDGYGADLTGATGKFSVKKTVNDQVYVFQKDLYNHPESDLTCGTIFFKINSSDTQSLEFEKYFYDIQIQKPVQGDEDEICTIAMGDFWVVREIT